MLSPSACCRLPLLIVQALAVRLLRLRCIYKLLLLFIVGVWIVLPMWQYLADSTYQHRRACYIAASANATDSSHADALVPKLLPDILTAERQPTIDRTIFFVDTACRRDGTVQLNSRAACAIEAAARAHPQWDIFVLFASPRYDTGLRTNASEARFAPTTVTAALQPHNYPNVHWRNVNVEQYANGTPIADWINGNGSQVFARVDASDVLQQFVRYVSLFRYGGATLASDVIVRRPLDELGANWAATDRPGDLNDSVLKLGHDDAEGHALAAMLLEAFRRRYGAVGATSLSAWTDSVSAVGHVARTVCDAAVVMSPDGGSCRGGFRLGAVRSFYAVSRHEWPALFSERQSYYVGELVSDAYGVKLWTQWSGRTALQRERDGVEEVPVLSLAETRCPRVWAASGRYF